MDPCRAAVGAESAAVSVLAHGNRPRYAYCTRSTLRLWLDLSFLVLSIASSKVSHAYLRRSTAAASRRSTPVFARFAALNGRGTRSPMPSSRTFPQHGYYYLPTKFGRTAQIIDSIVVSTRSL